MTELNFYRFVMFWLVLAAIGFGVKKYGDYRVERFLANQVNSPPAVNQTQLATYPTPWVPQHQPNVIQALPRPTNESSIVTRTPAPPVAILSPPRIPGIQSADRDSTRTPLIFEHPPSPPVRNQQPPVRLPSTAPKPLTNPTVAEIVRIQESLGGSQIAPILETDHNESLDSGQLFQETVQRLQETLEQQPAQESSLVSELIDQGQQIALGSIAGQPEDTRELSQDEIADLLKYLKYFARQHKALDPEKSRSCERLARRLEAIQRR